MLLADPLSNTKYVGVKEYINFFFYKRNPQTFENKSKSTHLKRAFVVKRECILSVFKTLSHTSGCAKVTYINAQ